MSNDNKKALTSGKLKGKKESKSNSSETTNKTTNNIPQKDKTLKLLNGIDKKDFRKKK